MTDTDTLRTLEESLLIQAVCRNAPQVDALLAPGFREFGSSGRVLDKAGILASLQNVPALQLTMGDFAGNQTRTLRSSIWVQSDARWQMVFHQGTPTAAAS